MAPIKTQPTNLNPVTFLEHIEHPVRRADAIQLLELFQCITADEPVIWGDSIIGFGNYAYSTRGGDAYRWFYTGFSPRKQNLSLYIMCGFKQLGPQLARLGKHKTSVSCLNINKLADVDIGVLKDIIEKSLALTKANAG